jgi:hypothetical protein
VLFLRKPIRGNLNAKEVGPRSLADSCDAWVSQDFALEIAGFKYESKTAA